MNTTKEITSTEDLIDVRDVIARFEELEATIAAEKISEDNGAEARHDDDGKVIEDIATCGECGQSWNDALMTSRTPAPSARCPYEHIHEELAELKTLASLLDNLRGNGGDEQWRGDWYPITMISDSYFVQYAQELAEDIGAVKSDLGWPYGSIDWDKAAEELQMDYATVEFDDVTYWYR